LQSLYLASSKKKTQKKRRKNCQVFLIISHHHRRCYAAAPCCVLCEGRQSNCLLLKYLYTHKLFKLQVKIPFHPNRSRRVFSPSKHTYAYIGKLWFIEISKKWQQRRNGKREKIAKHQKKMTINVTWTMQHNYFIYCISMLKLFRKNRHHVLPKKNASLYIYWNYLQLNADSTAEK
jgi:hypothetical protein